MSNSNHKILKSAGQFHDRTSRKFKTVLCHGVFDVLHAGHLSYFLEAKSHGEMLIVSITPDRYVNKGPGRPYFHESIRAQMLAALEIVDFVVINDSPTAVSVIDLLKPDVYVKGPDYRDHSKDVTGEILNEVRAVESYGGKVVYTETETFSSSTLVNKFFNQFSDEQLRVIEIVKSKGGMEYINSVLDKISGLSVAVIGETIIDTYRFVDPQNISSKSPSISAKFLFEENYFGGAAAIVNHLETFVKRVNFVSTDNAKKIRYISNDKQQRIFEVTHIDESPIKDELAFIDRMYLATYKSDVAILADFGHGLFENKILEWCAALKLFVALNVQSNSSNYGFNPFTKHSRFDYLSIDLREAKVAFHDNRSSPRELIDRVAESCGKISKYSVTLGSNGSEYCGISSPAFTDNVVDATGAGDAYFAITSLLAKVECEPALIPFLGNVFAGLKTKIIGNKSAVTKAQFMKALTAILK